MILSLDLQKDNEEYDAENCQFLYHQLDLFRKLCYVSTGIIGLCINWHHACFIIFINDIHACTFIYVQQGRNEFVIQVLTRELNYLTWEEAFLCVRLDVLPDSLRAKYCDLIIGQYLLIYLLLFWFENRTQ